MDVNGNKLINNEKYILYFLELFDKISIFVSYNK